MFYLNCVRLEVPEVIDQLLDMSLHGDRGRPAYDMAPDYPLVLMECGYPGKVLTYVA